MLPEVKYELNVPVDQILSNIRQNVRLPLPQVQPHNVTDQRIAIVAGGPSLTSQVDEIKRLHADGVKFIATNASHDWLLNLGIRPSAYVMVDARAFNARFVKNWQQKTKYLIASQCHPDVFDALQGADVLIFHAASKANERSVLDRHYLGNYFLLPGGSTVTLRAITLMRMLGFRKMDVFGFDSCLIGDKHHGYDQPENDDDKPFWITVEGRQFKVTPAMHSQAKEFIEMVQAVGDHFELAVHGDGLIAHIIETGAARLED